MKKSTDSVNHPLHYGGANNPYEAIKVIRAWNLNFNLGNTIKYIARDGKKDKSKLVEDLEKALWYLQDEINFIKKSSSTNTDLQDEVNENVSNEY